MLFLPLLAGGQIHTGPWLQSVGPDSIVVCWETKEALIGTVTCFSPDGEYITAEDSCPVYMHQLTLRGLQAGTDYGYGLVSGSKNMEGHFNTSPLPSQAYTLAVWGDNRTRPDSHRLVLNQMALHAPQLIVNVGDMVTEGGKREQYKTEFFDPGGAIYPFAPLFVAVGNHETYGGDKELLNYLDYMVQPGNERWYAITYGNTRMIFLDSNDELDDDSRQYRWLENELRSEACQAADHIFLYLHHAPYCSDWHISQGKEEREYVAPLAEKYGVDIVFAGHYHCYERGQKPNTKENQTYYVVTGGGGSEMTTPDKFKPGGNDWEHMSVHNWILHFCLVQVEGKVIHYQAIDTKGNVIDEFVIDKE